MGFANRVLIQIKIITNHIEEHLGMIFNKHSN